jgi:hypothetical protein
MRTFSDIGTAHHTTRIMTGLAMALKATALGRWWPLRRVTLYNLLLRALQLLMFLTSCSPPRLLIAHRLQRVITAQGLGHQSTERAASKNNGD